MGVRRVTASGLDAVLTASALLQRARRADPLAGPWEAADVQWWWRRPRPSDAVDHVFWVDDQGPVAGALLTCFRDDAWQCDLLAVPGTAGPSRAEVWATARDLVLAHADPAGTVEVPVRDDDPELASLLDDAGLAPGETSSTAWLDLAGRPPVRPPAEGYAVVDRSVRSGPHPMAGRNGPGVAERLAACPLYDPALDLAVEAPGGEPAGYLLGWHDPTTGVGLVEPVRVEDDHQRRGLATAMLLEALDRLADRGATRAKIGFGTDAAGAAYERVGFGRTSTDTWREAPVARLRA